MIAFVGLFLPLLIAYAPTLRWVWDSWLLPDSYYSHGPLLPPLIALLVWHRRAQWRVLPLQADRRGWALLAPGLLLHAAGVVLMVDSVSAASLLVVIPGVAWLAVGAGRMRSLWSVFGLLLFALPLPMFVSGGVAFELKELALRWALTLADGLGVGVSRAGTSVVIAGVPGSMEVADPCSGLRSLVALTTLGYCIAFFVGRQRGARRWLLVLSAVPIAVLANIVRIAGICWVAERYGIATATTAGHDVLGAGAWLFALASLLFLDACVIGRRQ